MIDSHCHLNLTQFDEDREAVIERAITSGITTIVVPGVDLTTSQKAIELAEQYSGVFAAVGIHPNEAAHWQPNQFPLLRELALHPKVVAIGEIGLDYYRDYAAPEEQLAILNSQLSLAREISKPVIIHNREAIHDLWPIMKAWQTLLSAEHHPLSNRPGVFHSYDGDLKLADELRSFHFYLGISGPVTFKNAQDRQELVKALGTRQILLETDSPYLSPNPFRGRRNEPAHIRLIAEKIASLQEKTVEDIGLSTEENTKSLFMEIV